MKKLLLITALIAAPHSGDGGVFTQRAMAATTPAARSVAQSGSPQTSDAGISSTYVVGEVVSIDASGKEMVIKTDAGSMVTAALDSTTSYKRVLQVEKDLSNAAAATLADVGVGDRVMARGKVAADRKSVPARIVVVMSKADVAKKQERDRAEWNARGIVGVISAINPATKEITLQMRGRGAGPTQIVIAAGGEKAVKFRRYAPDSVKFSDAVASSFEDLAVGDQLRALGDRSPDGAKFTAEEIVSGSFRTIFGSVLAVNPQTREIRFKDLQSQRDMIVMTNTDSVVRRVPPELAQTLSARMQGGGNGGGGGAGAGARQGGGPPGGGRPAERSEGPTRGSGVAAAPAGGTDRPTGGDDRRGGGRRAGMMGGGAGGGIDFSEILERLPEATVAELKPGDMLIVSSTAGADPSRVTAIHLLSGVDALIKTLMQARRPGSATGGAGPSPNIDINFGIGLP